MLFSIFSLQLYALEKPISGKVYDAKTKQPLAFASIGVEGTSIGTISNAEGTYILNTQQIKSDDVVVVSYIGYQSFKTSAAALMKQPNIYLKPAAINLKEFQVSSRPLTVEEIIEKVIERYPENYPETSSRKKIFLHEYESAPFPNKDQIKLKKSNFVGLDKETVREFLDMMPDSFVEYQDAVVELYQSEKGNKLVPIQGISLEESATKDLEKLFEDRLATFFDDIEQTNKTTDTYYKFRSGIFSTKVGHKTTPDSTWQEDIKDSLNYHIKTDEVKGTIEFLLNDYASLDGKNWEFLQSTGKYQYKLHDLNIINDELVYEISFKPKRRGLYEGTMYISTQSFAVLQMDYAFAPGKSNENFHLMGIGHSMKMKKARVIFDQSEQGYYPKYILAQQHETASIEREFVIKKKEKRFLFDKELNEIKFSTAIQFDINNYWEVLVLENESISESVYANVTQPNSMKYKREFAFSVELWDNNTVIAPTSELQKYKRTVVE